MIFLQIIKRICYPQIEEKDLEELPEKLREGIITYFKKPSNFTKEHYQNIYHNLVKKDSIKFEKLGKKYTNKAKLSWFFQNTNYSK